MRTRYPSISETAEQILREVTAEQQIKTAERQILHDTLQPRVRTDIGQTLMKLAEQCRDLANNPEVSYSDLHDFVERIDARRTS